MRKLRGWIIRFAGFFNRQRKDHELLKEIESHLQMHIEDNLRMGMTPEEARRQAMIKLGGVELTKEGCRDQRSLLWVETLLQDVRYGARMLRKNPVFTAVAVLTLALGIGINAGIFTILNAAAFRPLPLKSSDQLVSLFQSFDASRGQIHRNVYGDRNRVSYSEYKAYRDNNRVFSGLIAYAPSVTATLGGERPQPVSGALVSWNYFDVLKAHPSLGRGFRGFGLRCTGRERSSCVKR